jgi:CRISPR/Cas system-associated exonuclease Cas4 (RecB family)
VTGFTDDRRAPHVRPWRLSATAAELWSSCPQAFSYQRELGIEEVVSRPLRIGRLMALTVERYVAHCFEHKVATDVSEIEAIARQVFVDKGAKEGALGLDALDEVIRICRNYAESCVLDLERTAGVEMELPPTGAEPLVIGGREVIGKVDRLLFDDDGRLAIVKDQKTNWRVWSHGETREKMQAKFYPILIFHSFPDVEDVEVEFEFIRFPGTTRPVRYTRAEAELERQNIEALALQMQKPGPRPATPGEHCAYCGYVQLCPKYRSARDTGVFAVPADAEEAKPIVQEVAVLEAGLERRKDALRALTSATGPISTNGVRVGFFESQTPRVDGRAFAEWADEHGVEKWDYLTVPATELKKLLRKRRSLEELIDYEHNTKFDIRRGGDSEEVSAV